MEYLEAKGREFRTSMPAEAFLRMNQLIDHLPERRRRWKEQRAEEQVGKKARVGGKSASYAPRVR